MDGAAADAGRAVNEALIVESRIAPRREILLELVSTQMVDRVIEAESVSDGFKLLAGRRVDACLLGPSLSRETAVRFLRDGRKVSPECAYVVVRSPASNDVQALISAGAHAAIGYPLQPRTFSQAVKRAIERAKEERSRDGDAAQLHFALERAAVELRTVAAKINSGSLKLSPAGAPSLATRDAIRLALEVSLSDGSLVNPAAEIGSFDHHFVSCLVEWFADRVTLPAEIATERLRQKLLAFSHS